MNKVLLSTAVAAFMALAFTGCADKEPQKPKPISSCIIDKEDAPFWACGIVEGYDDMYTDTGTAKMSKAGAGFSRKNAMADGRSNLAQQIQTLVKDKIENFTRSTGLGEAETVDTVSTQVGKQVAKVSLSGSKQLAYWQHPQNNDIYVLVGVTKESVNNSAKDGVMTSFKNQDALWQQFQAQNAQEALEKEFEDK